MSSILQILQIISAVLFALLVLIQERGTGMGTAFGGSAGGTFYATKRGAEKVVARATILMAVLFIGLSFAASVS